MKLSSRVLSFLILFSLVSVETVLAATIDEASRCFQSLTSRRSAADAESDRLRANAVFALEEWWREEMTKLTPARRDEVLARVERTEVDLAPTSDLTGIITLVRQLAHSIEDSESSSATRFGRVMKTLFDPRSRVFMNRARVARAEYRVLTALLAKMPPADIHDAIFGARGVKPEHRRWLARILEVTRVEGSSISVDIDDDLARELAEAFDSNPRALAALIRELRAGDLATILRVERVSERRFVLGQVWRRYKALVASEYALKLFTLGVPAAVLLSYW